MHQNPSIIAVTSSLLIALTLAAAARDVANGAGASALELTWQSVEGGGAVSGGGDFIMAAKIGQPDAGPLSGGDYELAGGFWALLNIDACPTDVNDDTMTDVVDLLGLLADWGACPAPCPSDIDSSGQVDVVDLLALLAGWGACP